MRTFFAAVLVAFCVCSCCSVEKNPRPAAEKLCPDSRYIEEGKRLLAAIRKHSYAEFSAVTAACGEPPLPEKEFDASCRELALNLGEITTFRFLTFLQTPAVRNLIYLVTLTRREKNGSAQQRELLFQLIMGEENGKIRLLGFRFL